VEVSQSIKHQYLRWTPSGQSVCFCRWRRSGQASGNAHVTRYICHKRKHKIMLLSPICKVTEMKRLILVNIRNTRVYKMYLFINCSIYNWLLMYNYKVMVILLNNGANKWVVDKSRTNDVTPHRRLAFREFRTKIPHKSILFVDRWMIVSLIHEYSWTHERPVTGLIRSSFVLCGVTSLCATVVHLQASVGCEKHDVFCSHFTIVQLTNNTQLLPIAARQ